MSFFFHPSERQSEALQVQSTEARAEAVNATRRVLELEKELETTRASLSAGASSMGLGGAGVVVSRLLQQIGQPIPSKEDVLAGLGLEVWKDDRLRWKNSNPSASDLESATSGGAQGGGKKAQGGRGVGGIGSRVLGQVSLRVWLLALYLLLLHVAVMVSFTHSNGSMKALGEGEGCAGSMAVTGKRLIAERVVP